MSLNEEQQNGTPSLNPFAFPPETNVRFGLLIVIAVAFSWEISFAAVEILSSLGVGWETNPITGAIDRVGELQALDHSDLPRDEYHAQERAMQIEVVRTMLRALIFWTGPSVAVLLVAGVLYWTHPARIRRRNRAAPLARRDDPLVRREVERIVDTTALPQPVAVELGQGFHSDEAQAYGTPRRHVLLLGGGLRLRVRNEPDEFRALVLHELAHVVNGDIARTYLAQALWISVVAVALAPTVASSLALIVVRILDRAGGAWSRIQWARLWTVSLPAFLPLVGEIGVTLAVVYLIRASLLRVRERYADWRATMWGAGATWSEMLQRDVGQVGQSFASRWLRLHPPAEERLAALHDPASLFRAGPDLPFLVGFLVAAGFAQMPLFMSLGVSLTSALSVLSLSLSASAAANTRLPASVAGLVLSGLLIPGFWVLYAVPFLWAAYTVSGTLGIQAWRETIADEVSGSRGLRRYLRLGIAALSIALGLELGFLAMPFSIYWPQDVANALQVLLWLVAVTGAGWLCLVYARFTGRRVFCAHCGERAPHWKRRALTLALTALLGAFYLPLMAWRVLYVNARDAETARWLGRLIPRVLGAALVLYLVLFTITWALLRLQRALRPARCPFCGQALRQREGIGRYCVHCGHRLAPWLFARPAPLPGMERERAMDQRAQVPAGPGNDPQGSEV